MNLRHFIHQDSKNSGVSSDEDEISDQQDDISYFFYKESPAATLSDSKFVEENTGERKDLQRIQSCAVFHKIASGKGVPHTFIGK